MTVKYKIDRSYVKGVRDMIADCDTNLKDCSELFEDVMKEVFIPSTEKTFDAEGRPAAWKPLSTEPNGGYARRKMRAIGHTRILVYSEDLRDSVAMADAREYSIRDVGPRRVAFGTERPWAAVHQKTRPFLLIQDEDYEKILDLTVDWLVKAGRYEE